MDIPQLREKRLATPNNQVPLPALGPAFFNPDDAARFAHRLIGDFRSIEYGGVILKDAAGLYYATRPVRGKTGSFNPTLVLSTDADGLFIHPPGYSCYALYHSHPSNYDVLKRIYKDWTVSQVHTAVNFFSSVDLMLNRQNAYFAGVHYLSGVNGSLLKYAVSGSADELALANRIAEDNARGVLSFRSAIEFVRAAAWAGHLSIIQSSEVWDAKLGRISPDFKGFTPNPLRDIAPVIIQQPAFGPVFNSVELALKDVRARIHRTSDSLYGVLVRHKRLDRVMASEPVTGAVDFSLERIFGRNASDQLDIPESLEVIGFYCSDGFYRDPSLLPAQEASIFKHFIYPPALARGVLAAQRWAGQDATRALPLYISSRDGAMLQYVSTFASTEQKFLADLPPGEGGGLAILRDMLGGVYSATTYIRELAGAGELSVLHTSDLWRDEGRVGTGWQPYRGFYRRPLGASFVALDDAARDAHDRMPKRRDAVFGGLIYQRMDNRYVATEPLEVKNETFDPMTVYPAELARFVPHGCSVVAVYHSHRVQPLQLWRSAQEEKLYRNMLEPHEVLEAIKQREWAAVRYFSTQGGALLSYTPSGSALEAVLSAQLSPPVDNPEQVRRNPMAMGLRSNRRKPSEYVALLAQAGELRVVVGSALWGGPGRITPDWRVGADKPEEPRPGLSRVPLSPIFAQSEDAVRHAHEQMGTRQGSQFGVLLRSIHSEEYVVTLPVTGEVFSLERLFALDGQTGQYDLPAGFKLLGGYVGVPSSIDLKGHVADKRVYEGFVSPRELARALQFSRGFQGETGVVGDAAVTYISTRDGALLRFIDTQDTRQFSTGVFRAQGQGMFDQLAARQVSPVEYVQQVAMAVRLDVIVTNAVWVQPGPVTAGWQPFGGQVGPRQAPALRQFPASPVFSHQDDAARHAHQRIGRPHTVNIMGCLLREPSYDTYVALEPVVNNEPLIAAETILKTHRVIAEAAASRTVLPQGYALVSLHYARDVRTFSDQDPVETQLLRNMPWPEDICYATHTLDLRKIRLEYLYVSTDDGALLRYWRGDARANYTLCNQVVGYGWTPQGYFEENTRPTPLPALASEIMTRVLNSGGLRVLLSSDSWPLAGVIASRHRMSTEPADFNYDGATPGQPVAQVKVGPLRDEL